MCSLRFKSLDTAGSIWASCGLGTAKPSADPAEFLAFLWRRIERVFCVFQTPQTFQEPRRRFGRFSWGLGGG